MSDDRRARYFYYLRGLKEHSAHYLDCYKLYSKIRAKKRSDIIDHNSIVIELYATLILPANELTTLLLR